MEDLEAVPTTRGLVKVKIPICLDLEYPTVRHFGLVVEVLQDHPAIHHLAIAAPHLDHLRLLIPFFGET